MVQFRPTSHPARTVASGPVVGEVVERVSVRRSDTGWWIAGVVIGVILVAMAWILLAQGGGASVEDDLRQAALSDALVIETASLP